MPIEVKSENLQINTILCRWHQSDDIRNLSAIQASNIQKTDWYPGVYFFPLGLLGNQNIPEGKYNRDNWNGTIIPDEYHDMYHPDCFILQVAKPISYLYCNLFNYTGRMTELINRTGTILGDAKQPYESYLEWLGRHNYAFMCQHDEEGGDEIAFSTTFFMRCLMDGALILRTHIHDPLRPGDDKYINPRYL